MFAYCGNNPTIYFDDAGYTPSQIEPCYSEIGDNNGDEYVISQYLQLKASYEAAGITLYYSAEAALNAWIIEYLPLSKECEYTTLLYSVQTSMGLRYYTSRTIRGAKNNVILGTIALAFESQLSTATFIAHIHTHPNPGAGYHNDFPSLLSDGLGGDQLASYLFGFPEMYIIPYKRCSGTPTIMVYSDISTWCSHRQYK